jgi:hypothetical protein
VRFIQVALVAATLCSLGAVALPDEMGRRFGQVTVAVLILTPLIRLSWLAGRWIRRRDFRYAAAATVLALVIVVAGLAPW